MTRTDLFDSVFSNIDSFARRSVYQKNYVVNTDDEGVITLTVSVPGHTKDTIDVNLLEDEVHIKSNLTDEQKENPFVFDVDLKFSIGRDYDGTNGKGTIENGILTLIFEKREARKAKKLKLLGS